MRWRPGERPENRWAAGERIILLLIGVGVELVINALMQERLPEVRRLIITLQQALKWRDKGGHQEVVFRVVLSACGRAARRGGGNTNVGPIA